MPDYLSFHLSDAFVGTYKDRPVEWGFKDAGGTALGEITFIRTYARLLENGKKERWYQVCRRVIEGMFSIQKDWCKANRLPWNDNKAQRSAQEGMERLFTFKWTPPGRGLWMMGTPLVNRDKNSAALQNCAFVSTADMTKTDPTAPFVFLMEASMLGIGVGFDYKGADKGFTICQPEDNPEDPFIYRIPDSREGWVESVRLLLESYLKPGATPLPHFDYSHVRPAGQPIKTFGGTAAGPEPLSRLHRRLVKLLGDRDGDTLTRRDIVDIMNMIGVCIVSGNVRRSAEIALGWIDDKEFIHLKDPSWFPERNFWEEDGDPEQAGWGYMSNNSVEAKVGDSYRHLADSIAQNGEPGIIWMDMSRKYGRLIDPPNNRDHRAAGYNPCGEQTLESFECCTLVETYITKHESLEDYKRTLKYAYMYAKAVTLLPTHWQRTNAIMQRNRRIGTSISGISTFADVNGMSTLKEWMNQGYQTIQDYDEIYSEWLCVRRSIKSTTIKPGGTTPLLPGVQPGCHYSPGGKLYYRLMRYAHGDPIVKLARQAGYRIEPDVKEPDSTSVIYFPILNEEIERGEKDVSIFEKINLAVVAQRYWSDNSVSVTVTFDPETEAKHIPTVLHMYEGQLKTVSFLPSTNDSYPQMPYTPMTFSEYEDAQMNLFKIDFTPIYEGDLEALDAVGEAYCTTDACEVRELVG